MNYLYGYLGIGIVVVAIVYGAHLLRDKDDLSVLADQIYAARFSNKSRFAKFMERFVEPFVGVVVILGWPIALYVAVKDAFESIIMLNETETSSEREMPSEFAVERRHLVERLTIQAVEARERVVDPLNAVPESPFGHLNVAWKVFLVCLPQGAELWSYSAPGQGPRGDREMRQGYVLVHNDTPGAYFQTMCKNLP